MELVNLVKINILNLDPDSYSYGLLTLVVNTDTRKINFIPY